MTRAAAERAFNSAGIGPEAIDVVEMHDCFAQNELISYEALGLCAIGEAERFVMDGDNTYEIGRAHAELQSLMRISYAVFCLKKKKEEHQKTNRQTTT